MMKSLIFIYNENADAPLAIQLFNHTNFVHSLFYKQIDKIDSLIANIEDVNLTIADSKRLLINAGSIYFFIDKTIQAHASKREMDKHEGNESIKNIWAEIMKLHRDMSKDFSDSVETLESLIEAKNTAEKRSNSISV